MKTKSHAELSEEHYHLVRTNPEYRMKGQMLLLEERMAPAHNREEPREPQFILAESKWEPKQWDIVDQLRNKVTSLQNKLNEHIDKKRKYNIYTL